MWPGQRQTICNWVSYKVSPTANTQRTRVPTLRPLSSLHQLDSLLGTRYQKTTRLPTVQTHSTSPSHNTHHYRSSTHVLHTHYSPLAQPSLPVGSLTEDPPPLTYTSLPLTLYQKLPDTSQRTNQTQVPLHLCSSVTHSTLINNKCTPSIH